MNEEADHNAAPEWLKKGCGGCLVVVAVLLLFGWLGFKGLEHSFAMARIPANLSVTGTVYSEEKTYGIGPGGNETGLSVYSLDEDDAAKLNSLAPQLGTHEAIQGAMGVRDVKSHRRYYDWQRTPVSKESISTRWGFRDHEGESGSLSLAQDLGRQGFPIPVDDQIAREVDDVLNNEGAYYAFGGGGAIIAVAPEKGWIIYMFRG